MIVRPLPPPPPDRIPDTVGGTWIDWVIWAVMVSGLFVATFFLLLAVFG